MNWDFIGSTLGNIYFHAFVVGITYLWTKSAVSEKVKVAGGLTLTQRRRVAVKAMCYGIGAASAMMLFVHQKKPELFVIFLLVLVPMIGLGLSDGFRTLERAPDTGGPLAETLKARDELDKVTDLTLMCIFQPYFCDGLKDDYISQTVNRVGWPKSDLDWGKTFLDDAQLWVELRRLVVEHALAMKFDDEMSARLGVVSAVYDEDHKRQLKSSMRHSSSSE